jgi:hypothetical protein
MVTVELHPVIASTELQRLKSLLIEGDNVLASAAGPDMATRLRRDYLRWRTNAESALISTGAEQASETLRHRDIVRDHVPADRIYVEVEAEIKSVQRAIETAVQRSNAATLTVSDGVDFTSDRGVSYRYNPLRPLGPGGRFGRVYEGTNAAGAHLAVKVVDVRTDPLRAVAEWALVNREVEIAQQVSGRAGLVPILDHAHQDDRLLILMPLAEQSLAQAINDGLTHEQAGAAIRDVAEALRQLAAAGVVHRDIKPGNVLSWRGRWCIADFGISRIAEATTATNTWAGTGTHEYRAPELWRGEPETVATDLYAFGCLAFEAVTGKPAFPGPDFYEQHATRVPVLPADLDPQLERVILQLLAKVPEQRPADARRVLELLAPVTELSVAHAILRQRAVAGTRRDRDAEALSEQQRRRAELRVRALSALQVIWTDLVLDTKRAVPDAIESTTSEGYFLIVGDARLAVVHADPGDDLLATAKLVVHDGEGTRAMLVANLVADEEAGMPRWRVVTWTANAISQDRFEPGPAGRTAGLEDNKLSEQWRRRGEPIPPLVSTLEEATSQSLLDLFVGSLSESTDR